MAFGTFWCKLAPSFFWLLARFSKLISLLSGESQLNIKNDPNETDQIMGPPLLKTLQWLLKALKVKVCTLAKKVNGTSFTLFPVSLLFSPSLLWVHQAQSCCMALYCLFHLPGLLTQGIHEANSLPPLGFYLISGEWMNGFSLWNKIK